MALRKVVTVAANSSKQTIELTMNSGRKVDVKVNLCKIVLDTDNNLVYLYDASQSQNVSNANANEPNFYALNYLDITSPVTLSAALLFTAVLAMLAEAGGGGGDATAANQVIGNAFLDTINDNIANLDMRISEGSGLASVYKNASDESVFMNAIGTRTIYDEMLALYGVTYNSVDGVSWFKSLYDRLTDTVNTGRPWSELILRSRFGKTDTTVVKVVPAPNATFATAQESLRADLQAALRGLVNYTIIDVSQGMIFDPVGNVWQGWANVSYNITLI